MRVFMVLLVSTLLLVAPGQSAENSDAIWAEQGLDSVQRLQIVSGAKGFEPSHILVKVGSPVELTFINTSQISAKKIIFESPITGSGIQETIRYDKTVLRFTVTRPGIYPFSHGDQLVDANSSSVGRDSGILEARP